VVLIVAALLKADHPQSFQAALAALGVASWWAPWLVLAELWAGAAMVTLAFSFPRQLWYLAFLCFAALAIVSAAAAAKGIGSCGCLGHFAVAPAAMSAFDLVALGGLLVLRRRVSIWPGIWRRRPKRQHVEDTNLPAPAAACQAQCSHRGSFMWLGSRLAAPLVLGIGLTVVMVSQFPLFGAAAAPGLTTFGDVTVVEPREWIGKELPILSMIDIGDELETGEWAVVFYHHNCSKCVSLIEQLSGVDTPSRPQIAIVQLPPYGSLSAMSRFRYGKFGHEGSWFFPTPSIIHISNGKCTGCCSLPDNGFITQSRSHFFVGD
jgi:hypothetical protein